MAFRLPSLGAVVGAAIHTSRRFPLAVAASLVAALAAILTQEDLGPDALHGRLLAASSLGLPLFTAVTLSAERKSRRALAQVGGGIAALAALGLVYLGWPHWSPQIRFIRYVQLSAAFHLLVAFLPFVAVDRPAAFWQYNRALLERFLAAGITALTLFGGLALALAAVDKLFGVDVPEEGYFRLWAAIAFVVTTWVFLGGVPADLDELDAPREYPAALRIFARYVLLPLVWVYLVILALYFAKVIVTWQWPSGWIGWLVSGVASAGILTLLLVHPIAGEPDQRWVAVFARTFWLAMPPAVVMLWLALYQRVHQYGVSEPRYFLFVMSLWLFVVAVYYSVTRSSGIRVIPASLCAVAVATWAGPWGAYAVSERSQLHRLERLLTESGALEHGQLRATTVQPSLEVRSEVSAVVRYLVETHGTARLAPWIGDDLASRAGRGENRVRTVVRALGFGYVDRRASASGTSFRVSMSPDAALPLSGYERLLRLRVDRDTVVPAGTLAAVLDRAHRIVRVSLGAEPLIEIPLDSMLARAQRLQTGGRRAAPAEALSATGESSRGRAMVYFQYVNLRINADSIAVQGAGGEVLVSLTR